MLILHGLQQIVFIDFLQADERPQGMQPSQWFLRFLQHFFQERDRLGILAFKQQAMGSFPVGSFDAYMARVPADRKDWKIVPVDSRELPTELRDRPKPEPAVSDATVGWLALSALALTAATPVAPPGPTGPRSPSQSPCRCR